MISKEARDVDVAKTGLRKVVRIGKARGSTAILAWSALKQIERNEGTKDTSEDGGGVEMKAKKKAI